jgi:hypothetical protein
MKGIRIYTGPNGGEKEKFANAGSSDDVVGVNGILEDAS